MIACVGSGRVEAGCDHPDWSHYDDDMEYPEVITLNNLSYCVHFRDVCHECSLDFMPFCFPFELPEHGRPEYPVLFRDDDRESALLAKRWLEMQRTTYAAPVSPLTSSHVQLLPKWGGPAASVREAVLGLFHQVLPMCATQRYFFANQPLIMLQDCETFVQAIFLHEANLQDSLDRNFSLLALRRCVYDVATEMKKKSRASYVGAFGFLLELHTQRTFWRTMELTAEAYIRLLEQASDDNHDDVLREVKTELLQWIGHVFWSFCHAQHVLDELRKQQHMIYSRNEFPFYPACDLDALEAGLDVHLIIAKLSRGPAHDFPFMASAFDAFRQASDGYPEQMVDVSSAIMVAIDEMSARFRVLELLTRAGQAVASCELEVKTALLRFKFDSTGIELFSAMSDAFTVITEIDEDPDHYTPTPKDRSFLQTLLALERSCRLKHRHKLLTLPVQDTCTFTKEMFDAFKATYSKLYRDSIRTLWKDHEKPLLQLSVKRRPYAVQTQRKKKKKPAAGPPGWEVGDIAEARSVPDESIVDPELFWNTGAPPAERYKPPVVREKIKTRKATDLCTAPAPSPVEEESPGPSTPSPRRALDQLKESDLTTRDVLWRKVKGLVKWSSIVQLLARLGCKILNLDGSKKKVVDEHTGRCTVLHRPHPGEDCRRDQLDRYRMQLEDWLDINYEDIVTPQETTTSPLSTCTSTSTSDSPRSEVTPHEETPSSQT